MRKSISVLVLTVMTLLAPGMRADAPAAAPPAIRLVSLEDSLSPLKDAFNNAQGKPRILVLLSPT
jgi:hypothetical protein